MLKKLTILVVTLAITLAAGSSAFAYNVKSGDTMYNIAKTHEMSLGELAVLNPQVTNINLIYVNQVIKTNSNNSQPVSKSVVKPISKPIQAAKAVSNVNVSEIDLLARLVRAEAQGESLAGKVAVAEVVLNRVDSPQFPNSIKGVIYQPGQFSPVSNGSLHRSADNESRKAAEIALSGTSTIGNALFFYNPRTANSRWLDNKPTQAVIGNHAFK